MSCPESPITIGYAYARWMARRVVFDPTERELFDEQRQGFDWTLLQSGFVFRYAARFQFDSACTRLTDLGYLVHEFDAQEWDLRGGHARRVRSIDVVPGLLRKEPGCVQRCPQ